MFNFLIFRFNSFFTRFAGSYDLSWPANAKAPELYRRLFLRPDWSLPFYCQPINLFVISWLTMLAALWFRISYDSYPQIDLPILLFLLSLISLLGGYTWFRSREVERQNASAPPCTLNITRLRRLNNVFALIAIAIMVLNVKLEGLPPAFGFLSFDTKVYLEYGRFKQLLFPLLIVIVVNSLLDPSRFRKLLFSAFGLLSLLLYITRGGILGALLQSFFVFTMTTKVSRKKLTVASVAAVVALAALADVVGNNRTTQAGFLTFLQIRSQFWEWPMIFLWVIAYFSIPLSNLCWIVDKFHFHTITLGFLIPALPSFWTPSDPHEAFISGNSHIVDNVHTYLAPYFLDFSYAGIFFANIALGAACAFVKRRGMTRHFLTTAVFLGCVSDIFFNDNFIPLSTLLQFAMQAFAQQYLLSFTQSDAMEIA
jgi:oligosaccharide repeat unit polymerase